MILAVAVTGANAQDRDGGQSVLKGLKDCFPRVARVWADGAYAGRLVEWAEKTAKFVLDIVCKPKGQIGFCVLPWRWSEPSLGWATIVAWLVITRSVLAPARLGSKSP